MYQLWTRGIHYTVIGHTTIINRKVVERWFETRFTQKTKADSDTDSESATRKRRRATSREKIGKVLGKKISE
jgi:hypothetical protein